MHEKKVLLRLLLSSNKSFPVTTEVFTLSRESLHQCFMVIGMIYPVELIQSLVPSFSYILVSEARKLISVIYS